MLATYKPSNTQVCDEYLFGQVSTHTGHSQLPIFPCTNVHPQRYSHPLFRRVVFRCWLKTLENRTIWNLIIKKSWFQMWFHIPTVSKLIIFIHTWTDRHSAYVTTELCRYYFVPKSINFTRPCRKVLEVFKWAYSMRSSLKQVWPTD